MTGSFPFLTPGFNKEVKTQIDGEQESKQEKLTHTHVHLNAKCVETHVTFTALASSNTQKETERPPFPPFCHW